MKILGIETSCDETAAAILSNEGGRVSLLSNIVSSQIALHKDYGGVVPELASRRHLENLPVVLDEAYRQAGVAPKDLSAVAVTYGPGLVGCLYVGLQAAKVISWIHAIPLVGVNHLEAHLFSVFLETPAAEVPLPYLGLVASGGHTFLALVQGEGVYRVLGRTRDDAAGEAFDKAAKALGLQYPGGPALAAEADHGNAKLFTFPVARMKDRSADFSFSGLKTALANHLAAERAKGIEPNLADVAASFQEAVVASLIGHVTEALETTRAKAVVLGGGVAANRRLRQRLTETGNELGVKVFMPSKEHCTDNGAMIAMAGLIKHQRGDHAGLDLDVDTSPVLPLERSRT